MTDTYTDPNSTYGTSGTLMPQVAAAYARDPRRLLVQSLISQGQQATSRPSYSTFSALANALTGAASGVAPTILNNEYKDQNQQVMDAMRSAYGGNAATTTPAPQGKPAVPAFQNPDQPDQTLIPATPAQAPQSAPARPPITQYELTAHTFLSSNNPVLVQQGVTMMQNLQQMQMKQSGAAREELLKQGLGQTGVDANGNPVAAPIAGYGAGKATNAGLVKGAETSSDIAAHTAGDAGLINARSPAEAAAAAAKAQAENAPLIARAGGITAADLAAQARGKPAVIAATAGPEAAAAAQKAAATAPIEVFKAQFNPQVDRATGELVIPGLDPEVTGKVMAAMGIDKTALAASMGHGAPNAAPAPAPPAQGMPMPVPGNATAPAPGTAPAGAAPVTTGNPPPTIPPVVVPPVGTKPSVGQAPAPGAAPAPPAPYGTKSPADEVPTIGLPTGLLPKGPGTIIQGRDPVAIAAGEGAVKQADEQYHDTQEAAKSAGSIHSELGTMRTMLQNGGFNTNATAPARAALSSYLNATMGPDIAKSVTSIDPAQAEVFNKDATRMGLTFARQTEGAREAVAAIKIALGANPSLANTMEGNKKIIDLLDAGTQHDLAAQQYGDAFFNKNSHYVGFQGWMNQNHPPAEFTSKVVPYNLPAGQNGAVDPSQLQPNVTYNLHSKNYTGPAIWTGNGFKPAQ